MLAEKEISVAKSDVIMWVPEGSGGVPTFVRTRDGTALAGVELALLHPPQEPTQPYNPREPDSKPRRERIAWSYVTLRHPQGGLKHLLFDGHLELKPIDVTREFLVMRIRKAVKPAEAIFFKKDGGTKFTGAEIAALYSSRKNDGLVWIYVALPEPWDGKLQHLLYDGHLGLRPIELANEFKILL